MEHLSIVGNNTGNTNFRESHVGKLYRLGQITLALQKLYHVKNKWANELKEIPDVGTIDWNDQQPPFYYPKPPPETDTKGTQFGDDKRSPYMKTLPLAEEWKKRRVLAQSRWDKLRKWNKRASIVEHAIDAIRERANNTRARKIAAYKIQIMFRKYQLRKRLRAHTNMLKNNRAGYRYSKYRLYRQRNPLTR